MKRTSHTNLKDLRKIYSGLNTLSILKIYRKLDPFSKLRCRPGNNRKASAYESINIIIVRCIIMIYSMIINAFLTLLFGVKPVSVLIHSVSERTDKNNIFDIILISASVALCVIVVAMKLTGLSSISLILILSCIIIMHLTAFIIVKKKYSKISFELCSKE